MLGDTAQSTLFTSCYNAHFKSVCVDQCSQSKCLHMVELEFWIVTAVHKCWIEGDSCFNAFWVVYGNKWSSFSEPMFKSEGLSGEPGRCPN